MLHLNFAPSLDMLVPELLPEVSKVWSDPFIAPDILVPSPALGKWLRMRLADGTTFEGAADAPFGCVANLCLPTIEKYLWDLLQPGDSKMLDQQHLQQVLCALLDEECINQVGFEPVKAYLSGASGIDPLKKVQLSARIAHQFLEYEYNRPGVWRKKGEWKPPGIDGTWMAGGRFTNDTVNEPWQAELYRRMRACFSQPLTGEDGRPVRYLTLPQLYRLRREAISPADAPLPLKAVAIFMFGITKISHFHRNLFVEISQIEGVNLHVYLTNPCAEFWEDVNTSRSSYRRTWRSTMAAAAITPRTPDDYDKPELDKLDANAPLPDQKLLELWGNAGKENIFLWCQDARWNFDYASPAWVEEEKAPATLLQSLQYSLLRRQSELTLPTAGAVPDTTLQILACPDPGREMEEIREQILDAVHDGTVSMLNEIVVYLTDPTSYLPYIQRVFGRFKPNDPGYIPFCILGTSGKETAFAQGIHILLEIMRHQFDRAHVFGLLHNPIVQETRNITPEDVAVWEQWAEELAIFRGYNREHRRLMGDTGVTITDAHTFELGMARMLLANLAAGPVDLYFMEQTVSESPEDAVSIPVIPYCDFNTSDRQKLELFCATIESLHHDCSSLLEDAGSDIETAVEAFINLVQTWMGKIPDNGVVDSAAEGSMLREFYDGVGKILLQRSHTGRDKVPFEEFCALVSGCLSEEGARHSTAWTGGITFAPLKPATIVPHTVVFAAGLDDVLFPGSNEKPSWDLLACNRIIGDSDRVRDNRFAFLELLHAARKRLILSYRAKDMQKEAELHASSVVLELEGFLCDNGFSITDEKGKTTCAVSRTIPWIVHESLRSIAEAGRKHGSWNRSDIELARVAHDGERKTHRYELDASSAVTVDTGLPVHFSVYEISEYLKNPLEYHLARTLAISSDESPNTITVIDEPLASDTLSSSMLYRAVWIAVLRKMFPDKKTDMSDDIETLREIAYQEAVRQYTKHAASGNAPEAMMEEIEKNTLLRWARSCIKPLLPLKNRFTDHRLLEKTDLSLDRDGFSRTFDITLDNNISCTIDCSHNLVLIPRKTDPQAMTGIIAIKNGGEIQQNPNLCIEGTVQLLYEKKSTHEQRPIMLLQLNVSERSIKSLSLAREPLKIEKIRDWLARILGEMANRGSDHFPFTVIEKITRSSNKTPPPWDSRLMRVTRERIEKELTDDYGYTSFNPAFALVDPLLPSDKDDVLRTLAATRFGPILEGWIFDKETVS